MDAALTRHQRYNRSEKGKARSRAYDRRHGRSGTTNDRRVFGVSGYLGMAPTEGQADQLNALRKEFHDRQNT